MITYIAEIASYDSAARGERHGPPVRAGTSAEAFAGYIRLNSRVLVHGVSGVGICDIPSGGVKLFTLEALSNFMEITDAFRSWRKNSKISEDRDELGRPIVCNGAPVRVLRHLVEFEDALFVCGGKIRRAFATVDNTSELVYLEMHASIGRAGVAEFIFDRDCSKTIELSEELCLALGGKAAASIKCLIEHWFTLGFLQP